MSDGNAEKKVCAKCGNPDKKVIARGYCATCYDKARRAGEFTPRPIGRQSKVNAKRPPAIAGPAKRDKSPARTGDRLGDLVRGVEEIVEANRLLRQENARLQTEIDGICRMVEKAKEDGEK